MTHRDNAHGFCRNYFGYDVLAVCLTDPIKSMTDYIKSNRLDECGWGTDHEILPFATLCQIDVCVYSDFGKGRTWLKYQPLFCNGHVQCVCTQCWLHVPHVGGMYTKTGYRDLITSKDKSFELFINKLIPLPLLARAMGISFLLSLGLFTICFKHLCMY